MNKNNCNDKKLKLKKSNFRCKAHTSSFKVIGLFIPPNPDAINWNDYFSNGQPPNSIDIGCGYGRFLFKASKILDHNILGIEIRKKVYEYSMLKKQKENIGNVGLMNTNALLFLQNIVKKNSLNNIFILFPDPHFKKSKQKGRIICKQSIKIFVYLLKLDGKLYISTDIKELYIYMKNIILESNSFIENDQAYEKINDNIIYNNNDLFELTYKGTDEASRAGVKTGEVYASIFSKIK